MIIVQRHLLFSLLIAIGCVLLYPSAPAYAATTFTWSVSPDVITPQYDNIDIRPAYLNDGSRFWMVFSDGGNVVHRFVGTTLDNLTEQAHGILDGSFGHRYGEHYWLGGAYTDGHTWYATVHVEFDYHATPAATFNWFRKIGLATSTNKGLTWHYQGDIIFSAQSTNINDFANLRYFNDGPGDQSLFADWRGGYFYMYYTIAWVDKTTSERWEGTRVARCPIAQKMAPGCWTKWYDGGWSQPGIGGRDSDIFVNEDNASVFYDSFLGEYVAIGHSTANVSFIATATDLTAQDWTSPVHFTDDARMYWYNWAVDSQNYDIFTIGTTFRLYSAQDAFLGVPTKYMTVTLGTGENDNLLVNTTPSYPYTSVPDSNPGWMRSPDQPAGTVINADFEMNAVIPTGWLQYPILPDPLADIHIVANNQHSGLFAAALDASTEPQSLEQIVDVMPDTTYTLTAWAMEPDPAYPIYLGVKQYGGVETNQPIASPGYAQGSVTFTTGPADTTARIYLWKPSGGVGYADDVSLTAVGG